MVCFQHLSLKYNSCLSKRSLCNKGYRSGDLNGLKREASAERIIIDACYGIGDNRNLSANSSPPLLAKRSFHGIINLAGDLFTSTLYSRVRFPLSTPKHFYKSNFHKRFHPHRFRASPFHKTSTNSHDLPHLTPFFHAKKERAEAHRLMFIHNFLYLSYARQCRSLLRL